jgi:hypothetical protein
MLADGIMSTRGNRNNVARIVANYQAKGKKGYNERTLIADDDSSLSYAERQSIMKFLTHQNRNASVDLLVLCANEHHTGRNTNRPPMFRIMGNVRMPVAVKMGGTVQRQVVKFLTPAEKVRLIKLLYPEAVRNNRVVNRSSSPLLAAFAYSPVHNKLICLREDCLVRHAVRGSVPRAFKKSVDAATVINQGRNVPAATVVQLALPGEGTVDPKTGKVRRFKMGVDLSRALKEKLFGPHVEITRTGVVPAPTAA